MKFLYQLYIKGIVLTNNTVVTTINMQLEILCHLQDLDYQQMLILKT